MAGQSCQKEHDSSRPAASSSLGFCSRLCKKRFYYGPSGGVATPVASGHLKDAAAAAACSSPAVVVKVTTATEEMRPAEEKSANNTYDSSNGSAATQTAPSKAKSGPMAWFTKGDNSSRVRAANFDFGLPPDASAHKRWVGIANATSSSTVTSADEAGEEALQEISRKAAPHLRFLQLTVLSQEQLIRLQWSRIKEDTLEWYSPLSGIPPGLKTNLVDTALKSVQGTRALGALVGMAVGDALGAPFEFLDVTDDPDRGRMLDLKSFSTVGTRNKFRVSRGQWTDDTAMGLCLADTLLACGHYDGSDVRIRFHNWWYRGYNNAFGNDSRIGSVGLGGNVAKSLKAMQPGKVPSASYEAVTEDSGNGSLMRLAPVPIFYSRDAAWAAQASSASSSSTHPGPIAAAACAFWGYAIARAITRKDQGTPQAFLDEIVRDFVALDLPEGRIPELRRLLRSEEPPGGAEQCWNWRASRLEIQRTLIKRGGRYNGYPCHPDYFGSYCIDGLAVAMWCFYNTTTYTEAVVRCVNFLGDADTMSAICGQLAGAFYGYGAIDPRLLQALQVWDDGDVACRAALLHATRAHEPPPKVLM